MTKILVLQMPIFKRAYKKLHYKEKIYVDNAIQSITKDPKHENFYSDLKKNKI